jgi:uncharacterized protein YyaL (SSP411 family)
MPNSLINETSPYLLQHAHNPVDWHAWNEKTLEKARAENKMLLISIGYAACHWCHVMEHESFENDEVAKVMNEHFICIKVDREERPDVDQVYMDAAYLINGNGGWPLNALAMPDGKPFFAGTYFPKENWTHLLKYFADAFKNDHSKLQQQSENISKGIRDIEHVPLNEEHVLISKKEVDEMFFEFQKKIDFERGGTRGGMKFPMPAIWEFLLQYHYYSKKEEALKAVTTTLNHMAKGGIYDHVGGGFARYATDAQWHVPHFEKMLYDNAQLVSLYSRGFQTTHNPLYKKVVYETLEFLNRKLTSAEGGFYSSLDADSEGEEGKFYTWRKNEIDEILQDDAQFYCDYYGITSAGNWEHGKNIPDIHYGDEEALKQYNYSGVQLQEILIHLNKKLFTQRQKRIPPATDDKILTSWNALMVVGFIDAYKAFGEEIFFESAKRNIDFLLKNICTAENSLFRNYKNGKATIFGFLDDYAFLIRALIHFYQVSFDEKYLQKANDLATYTQKHFYNSKTGMFFYTDNQHSNLIARKMEVTDNVIPSSNSEMAKNLFLLSVYFENKNFHEQSLQMVKNILKDAKKTLQYYSNWAQAILLHTHTQNEVAIVGKKWKQKLSALQKMYLPANIYSGGENEGSLTLLEDKLKKGKTMIYVCKNKACDLPVENTTEALAQMESEN